jgi:hypothetical protein
VTITDTQRSTDQRLAQLLVQQHAGHDRARCHTSERWHEYCLRAIVHATARTHTEA